MPASVHTQVSIRRGPGIVISCGSTNCNFSGIKDNGTVSISGLWANGGTQTLFVIRLLIGGCIKVNRNWIVAKKIIINHVTVLLKKGRPAWPSVWVRRKIEGFLRAGGLERSSGVFSCCAGSGGGEEAPFRGAAPLPALFPGADPNQQDRQ